MGIQEHPGTRRTRVLQALGLGCSRWYYTAKSLAGRRRPGPAPQELPEDVVQAIRTMAQQNPWYGYKRIAVMCRRAGQSVADRHVYRVMWAHGLLQRRLPQQPELYQAAKLFELLPQRPNDLWQMDVTYLHIPGYGWWYAVTVIDYYSRYLLACHLTHSYRATEVVYALGVARKEAERLHGTLTKPPFLVTDNGPSFIAKAFRRSLDEQYRQVRIRYRTPTQLGLLERFHRTLKDEEVYWRLYDHPQHARQCLGEFQERYNTRRPHWALIPEGGGDPLTPADVYSQGEVVQIPQWQPWARVAKAKLEQLQEISA